jgi:endonuclease YncB( thermonuclease family)
MWRPYQIFIPLFSIFLNRVDLTDLIPMKMEVKLLEVLDGDTVTVQVGRVKERLRIAKIDAPEMGQPFNSGRGDAGIYSKKCLVDLLQQGPYLLSWEKRDVYGRLLGDINDVGPRMIAQGCAGFYPYASFRSRHQKAHYLRLYFESRQKKLGMWAMGGYQQPMLWRKKAKKRISPRQ